MNTSKDKCIEYFSQIFSYCIQAKIHFEVITDVISKSELIKEIETNNFSRINSKTPYEIFVEIFDKTYIKETSSNYFDRGYWCGRSYAQLFYEFNKSFSYIFLKLPLEKMMNMYDVYHELDISQLFDKFKIEMNSNSILDLLLKKHSISGIELSRKTGISIRTIEYYKKDDANIYSASFKILQRIVAVLDEPGNLFLEQLSIK